MDVAIVVGCQKYHDRRISTLKYAERDARRFAGTLANIFDLSAGCAFVLSTDNEHNGDPLNLPIYNSILRAITPPDDLVPPERLVFFFSGHGVEYGPNNEPYLLPSDVFPERMGRSAILISDVTQTLKLWKAKTTIIFLDICRAAFRQDKAGLTYQTLDKKAMDAVAMDGCAVFYSCQPGKSSFECEHPEVMSGVFTHALCNAFANPSSCRTILDLYTFLKHDVERICVAYQTQHQRQSPYLVVEPIEIQNRYILTATSAPWVSPLPSVTFDPEMLTHRKAPGDLSQFLPLVCAFDFGTSHSACAVCDSSGEVRLIPLQGDRALLPSALSFSDDLICRVGAAALEAGASGEYKHTIRNIKRLIGQENSIAVGGSNFSPEELASIVIRFMRNQVESYFGLAIEYALVASPTRFSVKQCEALLKACHLAGVNVARLIPEPSAASLVAKYLIQDDEFKAALVIDMGGGTLDVAVLEYGLGICEIKASSGDRMLGGVDYDYALFQYLMQQAELKVQTAETQVTKLHESDVLLEAERVKKALGVQEQTSALVELETQHGVMIIDIPVSRTLFRALVSSLDQRVEASIRSALRRARVQPHPSEVVAVVLAGLGAKVITLKELITKIFPNIPIIEQFQETAVVMGLGLYTGVLKGTSKEMLLLDAFPTQIGIRCMPSDGLSTHVHASRELNTAVTRFLERDATLPTYKWNSVEIIGVESKKDVFIYFAEEGEHLNSEEGDLGSALLPGIKSGDRIDVIADVDANRTVKMTIQHMKAIRQFHFSTPTPDWLRGEEFSLSVRLTKAARAEQTPGTLTAGRVSGPDAKYLEFKYSGQETPDTIDVAICAHLELYTDVELCTKSLNIEGASHFVVLVDKYHVEEKLISGTVVLARAQLLAEVQLNNKFLTTIR